MNCMLGEVVDYVDYTRRNAKGNNGVSMEGDTTRLKV